MYSRAGKVTAYLEFEVIGAVINFSLTMENVIDEDRRNTMQRATTELENSVNVDLFFPSMPLPMSFRPSMILQLLFNMFGLVGD
jgi:hypothetical protein